jgi:hypothetical protein
MSERKIADFPAIPCPSCGATISKPKEWGMKEYGLVWYYCKKCKNWTTQSLKSTEELKTTTTKIIKKCYNPGCNTNQCNGKDVTIKSGCMTATAIADECRNCPSWSGWE